MTEQEKRKKIINGLEWMAESYIGLVSDISKDALALLKAQELRLMTLEEAQKAEYVYLETRKWVDGDYHGTAKHKDTEFSDYLTEFVDGYGCVLSCDNAMYGDDWRCWTKQPTPEQREATPWN